MTSLPFLYPRLARPLRGTVVRQFLRGYSDSTGSSSSSSSTTTVPHRLRVRRDPIPFELPPDMEQDFAPEDDVPEGTITPMERQAFTKIFHDIARGAVNVGDAPVGDASATAAAAEIIGEASNDQVRAREHVRSERRQALEDARAASVRVLGALDRVGAVEAAELAEAELESAIPFETETAPDMAHRRRALAAFPPSLRSAASEALGSRERRRQAVAEAANAVEDAEDAEEDENDSSPAMIEAAQKAAAADEARQARQQKMEIVMLTKKTDAALWEYLESHVFSMVDEFGLGPNKKKTTKRTKPNAKMLAYGPLYPALLLHALKLLGGHYAGGALSPLALAVLPRIKSLGLPSYVLGASTPLYNELLRLHWARRGDALAVFALLQEMQQAGLAFDDGTVAVIKSMHFHLVASRDARGMINIDLDSVHRPLLADTTKGTSFVGAAMQHLSDVRAVSSMVQRWRQLVEAGAAASRRNG